MQRAAERALRALAIEPVRFLERVRIHRQRRVQALFVRGDPGEVSQHELVRGDAAARQRGSDISQAGLDDLKSCVVPWRRS